MKFDANLASFFGPAKDARRRILQTLGETTVQVKREAIALAAFSEAAVLARAQDFMFPVDAMKSKRLMVMVVSEHNDMSGGIYSLFSIARQMHAMMRVHGYDVLVMTRPNETGNTYVRLSTFRKGVSETLCI